MAQAIEQKIYTALGLERPGSPSTNVTEEAAAEKAAVNGKANGKAAAAVEQVPEPERQAA
jgi:hypothetical protein